jgi:hypothetical protein
VKRFPALRVLAASLAFVASVGLAAPARGENPCESGGSAEPGSGIGGTGRGPGDGGIGGTGHDATPSGITGSGRSASAPDETIVEAGETGIGGTGRSVDGGIRGTGRDADDVDRGGAASAGAAGIDGTGHSPSSIGIGGTGRDAGRHGDGTAAASGIGGTGRSDEGGIEGTGRDPGEGGIHGTGRGDDRTNAGLAASSATRGIYGTVTGYASLCVAGIEVQVDPASVLLSGEGTPLPAIGETVEVLASGEGDKVEAHSITRRPAAIGPVESIDTGAGTARVLAQDIVFDDATRSRGRDGVDTDVAGADLREGEMVRVSGLRRADGVIVAARLDRTSGDSVTLTGVVSRSARGELLVSRIRIDTTALTTPTPKKGEQVTVRGRVVEGRIVADTLEQPLAALTSAGVEHLDVEGFVANDGRTVSIGALQIEAPRSATVASGSRVRFSASIARGGAVAVQQVRPAIAPRPLHTARDSDGPRGGASRPGDPKRGANPAAAPHGAAVGRGAPRWPPPRTRIAPALRRLPIDRTGRNVPTAPNDRIFPIARHRGRVAARTGLRRHRLRICPKGWRGPNGPLAWRCPSGRPSGSSCRASADPCATRGVASCLLLGFLVRDTQRRLLPPPRVPRCLAPGRSSCCPGSPPRCPHHTLARGSRRDTRTPCRTTPTSTHRSHAPDPSPRSESPSPTSRRGSAPR